MNIDEALIELGKISALLAQAQPEQFTQTFDADPELARRFGRISAEAQEFAADCKLFHRRTQSMSDCRPGLRMHAGERRKTEDEQHAVVTPEEDAKAYADAMRTVHRK
jgi:hypothetical protein